MNRIIFLMFYIAAFVLLTCSSLAGDYETIKRSEIKISGYSFGDTIERKKADSVQFEYDPLIDDDTTFYYFFGKSYFSISNDTIKGFNLMDNTLSINFADVEIGDSSSKLKNYFPNSYSKKYSPSNKKREIVRVGIKSGEKLTDTFIHFELKNGIITSIYYWEDY